MMNIEFESSYWIHAIWIVGLLAVLFFVLEWRKHGTEQAFVVGSMRQRLARTASLSTRNVSLLLWVAAMVCFVVAIMRPQYGFMEKSVPQVGAQVMVCLDVSKSMLAEDASPNRLERAKSELEVLLNYLQGDQVGLIAFAGSASVMCPMTTDFGFLKMVLRETTTTSVGKGGTLLEVPIRQALNGFSDNDAMSKVVILITDGEDNGSKPLDAARQAAERGIKIITIGFGHERGSKIEITDPDTGLRSYVKAPDGKVVTSRLDLDMLKKIASLTQGACIPARVGSLDVETIHQEHLEPLMRSTVKANLVIRNEAFQWPLMAGIVLLFICCLTANPLAFNRARFGEWLLSRSILRLAPWVIVFTTSCCSLPMVGHAQDFRKINQITTRSLGKQRSGEKSETGNTKAQTSGKASTSPTREPSQDEGLGGDFSSSTLDDLVPEDPLESYNRSVDVLESNPEYAEKLLESARRNAGDNARLRYHSSYNLGWVNVIRANENLKEQPEEALRHLEASANWFREAVRLRPKNEAARQNLEIVLQRISELNDSLNQKKKSDFAKQLDELIQRQGELVETSRQLLEQGDQVVIRGSEETRKRFRLASVDQRILISDLQEAARYANQQIEELRREMNATAGQAKGQKAPVPAPDQQQSLQIAQLSRALKYADQAAQRLGQARRQLRLENARRAFLRGTLGKDEMKRARDQLRQPAQILRQIIADSELGRRQTLALIAGKNQIAAFLGNQVELPPWLDGEYLLQFQTTQWERVKELSEMLKSIMENGSSGASADSPTAQIKSPSETGLMIATDLIQQAVEQFDQARNYLAASKPGSAEPRQEQGINLLRDAYEQFADLKGLLELAYVNQLQVNQRLPAAQILKGDVLNQALQSFEKKITKNGTRLDRIIPLIEQEKTKLQTQPTQQSGAGAAGNNGKDPGEEIKRLNYATQLAGKIQADHRAFQSVLKSMQEQPPGDHQWKQVQEQSAGLEADLMELRRIFFSIVEHLKETVGRQEQLNLDTSEELVKLAERSPTQAGDGSSKGKGQADPLGESAKLPAEQKRSPLEQKQKTKAGKKGNAGKKGDAESENVNPPELFKLRSFGSRQAELASVSGEIGKTLRTMAETMSKQVQPGGNAESSGQQMLKNYSDAANLVQEGNERLTEASKGLENSVPEFDSIRDNQDAGLEKLVEALNRLEPPQDNQQQQNSKNDPTQKQKDQDKSNQSALQRIRDREAERRKNTKKMPLFERVGKDW